MNDSMVTGYAGVDWATDAHAVCIVDRDGAVVDEFDIEHDADGLRELCRRVRAAGAARVTIERPDGPVVVALLDDGLEVVVVSTRMVKSLRSRYGTSGNKCDRSDAYILADTLRTDGHRLGSLQPDTPATVTLRTVCRARKDLVEHRVAITNQLRAHLKIVFPGAIGLFSQLDSAISLRFLTRFPTVDAAAWLSEKRLEAWLRANRYRGRTKPAVLLGRLERAADGVHGADGTARATITIALTELITALQTKIDELTAQLDELLDQHPDAIIFRSLPRCGTVRAAALLSEIGDCRARFPDAESLCALAGVAPSTRASGRHHHVEFRWSSDKKLRNALCDFAGDSWQANPWAHARYQQLRDADKTHPHATRILARSWAGIIWRCWQDRVPYDPTRHTSLQRLLQPAT